MDDYGSPQKPNGVTLVAFVSILIIMGLYALARHLIGVPLV